MMDNHETYEDSTFRENVVVFSAILSIMVIMIHSATAHLRSSEIVNLIATKATCCSVPGFFFLSGFLFFYRLSWSNLKRKLLSRIKSLVVPYLIWNGISIIYITILTCVLHFGGGGYNFTFEFGKICRGLFLHSYNEPYWYMAYLIVFVFMSPVMWRMLQSKLTGHVLLLALAIFACVKIGDHSLLHSKDAIIYYTLGGYIAIHHNKIITRRTKMSRQAIGAAFIAVCVVIWLYNVVTVKFTGVFAELAAILMIIIYIGLVWKLAGQLPKLPQCLRFNTFFVYSVHIYFVQVFKNVFRTAPSLFMEFMLIFLGTVIMSVVSGVLLKRFFHKTYSVLTGFRN